MNHSETYKTAKHWPLTIQRAEDGTFKVSTPGFPGKSWTGADEMEATRAATRGIHEAQGKREMDTRPGWMKDEAWVSEAQAEGASKPKWFSDPFFMGAAE